MAYSRDGEPREVLSFRENSRGDSIKVNVYDEASKIDIRNFYTDEGVEKPNQKGVRLHFEELLPLVKEMVTCMETDEVEELIEFANSKLENGTEE